MNKSRINIKGKLIENLSMEEKQNLLDLYRLSEEEFAFKNKLFSKLNETNALANNSKLESLFNVIWNKIETQKSSARNIKRIDFAKIAAAVIIGLVTGYFLFQNQPVEQKYFEAKAPGGSISQIILPDRTEVFLNADSKLIYTLGTKNIREVHLTGEAWFNVEENKKLPFVVYTDYYNIRVTGTRFNVKAYPNDEKLVTTLEKGSVEICSSENLKIAGTIKLKPGEQLSFNKTSKQINLKEVNTNWFTSWKDNRLVFINMEFKDLVILLERKYGVDILVSDESVFNFHYDGTIKNESIFEVLDIIKQTIPIQYEIVGQKIEIRKR